MSTRFLQDIAEEVSVPAALLNNLIWMENMLQKEKWMTQYQLEIYYL